MTSNVTRRSATLAFAWTVAVATALVVTLRSLAADDFDGLNNVLQVPLALPWWILPLLALTGWGHTADAWATAAMGWLNAVLILFLLEPAIRRFSLKSH